MESSAIIKGRDSISASKRCEKYSCNRRRRVHVSSPFVFFSHCSYSLSACWLVRHLVLTYPEYNIVSLDKLDYPASRNNTRMLESRPNFTFVHADVTSPDAVAQTLKKYNIDTVFHFAAQSHVDHSFGNSYQFTTTNVLGTHVMLETARNYKGIKHFIHVSTDEVYGEVEEDGDDLPEESAMAPTNPYAATKAAAEMMVHAYWKSFKVPVITVRINNVFGPHQFPESQFTNHHATARLN